MARHILCLLKHGANVNYDRVIGGGTPLGRACNGGYIDVVKVLLQYGADINCTMNGKTALEIATRKGHTEIVELLSRY